MIVKVAENFIMPCINSNWEYYYLEQLFFLETNLTDTMNFMTGDSSLKSLFDLEYLLGKKHLKIENVFSENELSFMGKIFTLKSYESICKAYGMIKYQNENDSAYRFERLEELCMIFAEDSLFYGLSLEFIVKYSLSYLGSQRINSLQEFIFKRIFNKNMHGEFFGL